MRNLVIGCDGTWNAPDTDGRPDGAQTNVVRLLNLLVRNAGQRQHYEEGVGTRLAERIRGGLAGVGVDDRVRECYRFLAKRSRDVGQPWSEQRVFLFGFSRGAYTARQLAALIDFCGVPRNPNDADDAWDTYCDGDGDEAKDGLDSGAFLRTTIEMLGVWDTVKATDDPDRGDAVVPACVAHAVHAMSIDERRKHFPVLRWDPHPNSREVWFAGVHSDVGGGYSERELSDITLLWMVGHAKRHGLTFDEAALAAIRLNLGASAHESFDGVWRTLGALPRTILPDDLVHESVRARIADHSYRPTNIGPNPKYTA